MNGKELKVTENELKFGAQTRYVNVFGVFKYKPKGNSYLIYADVNSTYSYVCYGAAHIRNGGLLCMHTNKPEDPEIIKEYIFKVTNDEGLDDFEMMPLDEIKEIEIIGSKNFEIKPEVLSKLLEKTIPKKENAEAQVATQNKKKKGSPLVSILVVLLMIILGAGGYGYYIQIKDADVISKVLYCTKQYSHEELDYTTVEEEIKYKFNNSDKLVKIEKTTKYLFNNEEAYLDFINKSLYLKYMPENNEDTKAEFSQDNNSKTVTFDSSTTIDESYGGSIEYEEVLSNNNTENYTCEEKIEK